MKALRRRRPVLRTGGKSAFFLLLLLLASGILYEAIGRSLDRKSFPPVGKMVEVNGRSMHVYAAGRGDTTVVFAAGWKIPSPYVDFYPVWQDVAKHARVVVYDRPGYGWSQETDAPRNIDGIAGEIDSLLQQAGEKPPYVLVGHSIGSLEMLRFAQLHAKDVKGIVLIDGSNPEMYENMPEPSLLQSMRFFLFNLSLSAANKVGLSRLLFHTVPDFYDATPLGVARNKLEPAPAQLKSIDTALFLTTFNNKNQVAEGDNKRSNCAVVAAGGYLGDMPLTVLTSQELNSYSESKRNQENLKKWSTASEQIVVPKTGHAIHWDAPDVVAQQIIKMIR
jgi:pimeloyl-ACP methyl ester carboxylesterase